MNLTDLPTLNVFFNGTTIVLLLLGFGAIRSGKERRHKYLMCAAFAVSTLFLLSYLIYHSQVGSVPYQGTGLLRVFYFMILIPHILLAAVQLPLILLSIYKALKNQRQAHRALVKWTYPIWLYVSVSGIVVYLMLYRLS